MNAETVKNVIKLPQEAIDELFETYADYKDPNLKISVCADPLVEGTFAVRLTRSRDAQHPTQDVLDTEMLDLVWYAHEFDEAEFESWPPTSGTLKFFI